MTFQKKKYGPMLPIEGSLAKPTYHFTSLHFTIPTVKTELFWKHHLSISKHRFSLFHQSPYQFPSSISHLLLWSLRELRRWRVSLLSLRPSLSKTRALHLQLTQLMRLVKIPLGPPMERYPVTMVRVLSNFIPTRRGLLSTRLLINTSQLWNMVLKFNTDVNSNRS